jgi:hypothetical protein
MQTFADTMSPNTGVRRRKSFWMWTDGYVLLRGSYDFKDAYWLLPMDNVESVGRCMQDRPVHSSG